MGSQTTIKYEVELLAEFNYTPGTPDVHYLPNGDPGYPGEAPELEVTAVWMVQGAKRINVFALLSENDITAIEEDLIENWEEDEPDEDC